MSSPHAAHFDAAVQQRKHPLQCLKYVRQRFTSDLGSWLLHEPNAMAPWNLHFVSNSYDRGNDLSAQQHLALCHEHGTDWFWQCVAQNLMIPVFWHKTVVPAFYAAAQWITIMLDPDSHRWYHRAVWHKHYAVKDGLIHDKTKDPAYYPLMGAYMQQYHSEPLIAESPRSFIRREIINNTVKQQFARPDSFDNRVNRVTIMLSELLEVTACVTAVRRITRHLGWPDIDANFIQMCHQHWISCHAFKHGRPAADV